MLLSHDTSFLHPSEAGWKELWVSCKLMLDIKPNNLNMLKDREECWESSHVSIWQIKSSNPAHGVSSLLVFILGIWVDLKNQCLVYYTAYWDWERPTTTNNRWKIFIHRQENVNHPSLYCSYILSTSSTDDYKLLSYHPARIPSEYTNHI